MELQIYTNVFVCDICQEKFKSHRLYLKHKRLFHQIAPNNNNESIFICEFCSQMCASFKILINHIRYCEKVLLPIKCFICNETFQTILSYIRHLSKEINQSGTGINKRIIKLNENSKFIKSKQAFKNFLQQFELYPEDFHDDVEKFFIYYKEDIKELIEIIVDKLKYVKIQFCIQITFYRLVDNIPIYTIAYFITKQYISSPETDFENILPRLISFLNNEIQSFENLGSGWRIYELDRLDIKITLYIPYRGGCIDNRLPIELINKRGIISIKSNDNKCFLYCILAYIAINQNKYKIKLKSCSFEKVKIIPQTIEKFISLSLDTIQLLDSYQFLTDSLSNLVDNLEQSKNPFIITKSIFSKLIPKKNMLKEIYYLKSVHFHMNT